MIISHLQPSAFSAANAMVRISYICSSLQFTATDDPPIKIWFGAGLVLTCTHAPQNLHSALFMVADTGGCSQSISCPRFMLATVAAAVRDTRLGLFIFISFTALCLHSQSTRALFRTRRENSRLLALLQRFS